MRGGSTIEIAGGHMYPPIEGYEPIGRVVRVEYVDSDYIEVWDDAAGISFCLFDPVYDYPLRSLQERVAGALDRQADRVALDRVFKIFEEFAEEAGWDEECLTSVLGKPV